MDRKKHFGEDFYLPPVVEVITLITQEGILNVSADGVDLSGGGVNEGDADDNGSNVW